MDAIKAIKQFKRLEEALGKASKNKYMHGM